LSHANTAIYAQANTARNTANSAFDRANIALQHANTAIYAQANSSANTARVSANGGSTLSARQLNFVNTSTVTVSVTSHSDGSNANIAFTAAAATSPGGSNKQVQFNNSGSFGGAVDLVYDSATQRVGIGTAVPYKKFELVGGMAIGSTTAGSSQLGFEIGDLLTSVPSSQVRSLIGIGDSAIGIAGDIIYQPRGDASASHRFFIKGSEALRIQFDGRVGVGTNNPSSNLTVKSSTGSVGLNFGDLTSPNRGNMYYDTDGSGWKFQIGKLEAGTFTGQMTFVDSGNIGIANSNPQSVLTVGGRIESTSGGYRFPDGSTQTTASVGTVTSIATGAGLTGGTITSSGTLSLAGNVFRQASGGSYVGGNVFIGSSTPTAGAIGDIWIEI